MLKTFNTKDIMRLFHLSRVSVYRRLREARAGRGGFPLPIPMGAKRGLLWSAEEVRKFLHNANDTPQTPPVLTIESAKARHKRHATAMKTLERFGIKIQN